jgi:hypothetical protein
MKLHPKILAATLTAIGVLIVTVGNSVLDAYPDAPWQPILAAALVALAGWYKKSTGPNAGV